MSINEFRYMPGWAAAGGVGLRRLLPWVAIFLWLAGFYYYYDSTPLVRSYDTFFDLDQEIQIRRWLLPWASLVAEQTFHAEYIFRHPGGYYPRIILQPLVFLFNESGALAIFWAAIGTANAYLLWVISERLQPDLIRRFILFAIVLSSGAYFYANITTNFARP